MNQSQKKEGHILKRGMWFFGIAAAVCFAWGLYEWVKYPALGPNPNSNDWGNFGSYLQGTVASLWALAGVCLIVLTFLAQQQQLAEQREQFREQHNSTKRQNFEASFFQLLKLHDDIRSNMHATHNWGPG